jgi:hypothetical protein
MAFADRSTTRSVQLFVTEKPAYIEIACNFAAPYAAPIPISAVIREERAIPRRLRSRSQRLPRSRVGNRSDFANWQQTTVAGAGKQAIELADMLGCAAAVMAVASFRKILRKLAGI